MFAVKTMNGALRDAEDRRDRVDREQQVGDADRREDDEHRRPDLLAVHDGAQLGAVVVVADVDHAAQHPDDEVLALHLVVVVAAGERLPVGREDQERAEDVEHPAELLDDRGAEEDEDAAQDEGDDDAHHQHLLLVAARDRELAHDQHEDEEVVDRQAVLRQPAGDELAGVLRTGDDPHQPGEDQRERHVEDDPQGRLPGRRDVGALEDEQQIADEDQRQHDERADLEPERENEVHEGLSGGGGANDEPPKVSPPRIR